MPTVDWPSSPTVGQEYEFDNKTWIFTSTGAWKQLTNNGQVVAIWIKVRDYVYTDVDPLPTIDTSWSKVEYV